MSRRRHRRSNPSRSSSRRSSRSAGPAVATFAAVGYGVGALGYIGYAAYKAMNGLGRSVYATDLANALAWPVALAGLSIPPSGPVIVPMKFTALPPSRQVTSISPRFTPGIIRALRG